MYVGVGKETRDFLKKFVHHVVHTFITNIKDGIFFRLGKVTKTLNTKSILQIRFTFASRFRLI